MSMNINILIEDHSPHQNLHFRPMLSEDLDAVMRIETKVFSTPWHKSGFETELTLNRFARYYVLCESDKVIGYSGIWVASEETHLTTLAIDKNYQRKGLGSLLLKMILAMAYREGIAKISLEVRPSNIEARRLYAAHGFKVLQRWEGYYRDEDALIMVNENLDEWGKELAHRFDSPYENPFEQE